MTIKTVQDVFDTLTEEQKKVVYFIIGTAIEDKGAEHINSSCDGFRGGKIYDVKTLHKEDVVDAMVCSSWLEAVMGKAYKDLQKEEFRKHFEYPLTPKSIEQSVDHKTVVVIWQDKTKTMVKLSENDKDDINTAFAYALAKKIFGSNTHFKKVVKERLNEHKPKKEISSDEHGSN